MYVLRRRTRIEIWAPAKLNLFLEVLGRRADGFHEMETLMASISLFDHLTFTASEHSDLQLSCRWATRVSNSADVETLPTGQDNLVIRALDALRQASGVQAGLSVQLVKRIPTAAGLGGGSSDAAAALVAANLIWNLNWSTQRLSEIAATLGSDIPYFLWGHAAVCRGRGEIIDPLTTSWRQHLVVIRPPEGLSTPTVFRQVEISPTPNRIEPMLACLRGRRDREIASHLFNRLQPAAARVSPWIKRLQSEFDRLDVQGHQMSGSGSSYFGLCHSARHANRVSKLLQSRCPGYVFPTRTLPGVFERCTGSNN